MSHVVTVARGTDLVAHDRTHQISPTRKPDFTVTFHAEDGRKIKIGRIFQKHAGAPEGRGWAWVLSGVSKEFKKSRNGNASNFYEAKVALQRCWESVLGEQPLKALGALEKEFFDAPSGLHWEH